jgi:hypothetical protein
MAETLMDGLELAWGLIANAYGSDWDSAPKDWRDAAIRWRDEVWHPALNRRAEPVRGEDIVALGDVVTAIRHGLECDGLTALGCGMIADDLAEIVGRLRALTREPPSSSDPLPRGWKEVIGGDWCVPVPSRCPDGGGEPDPGIAPVADAEMEAWADLAAKARKSWTDQNNGTENRATPTLAQEPTFCFSCPACGSPSGTTQEPEVDIHSGATYTTECCGAQVVFWVQTVEQYVASCNVPPVAQEREPEHARLHDPHDHTFLPPSGIYCAICGMDIEAHVLGASEP